MSTRRLRIAMFTPLPPTASGIADYSHRLLGELREHVDVDVFVDGQGPRAGFGGIVGIDCYRAPHFDWMRDFVDYEVLLFCVGNSGYHLQTLPRLLRHGGVALLHDIHLAGLYTLLPQMATTPQFMSSTLTRLYNEPLAAEVRLLEHRHPGTAGVAPIRQVLRRSNAFLTGDIALAADRVLVHSDHAARIVRAETPAAAGKVHVLPFAFPATSAWTPKPGVVASFGIVAPEKHAPLLAAAAGILATRLPELEVRMVGDISPPYRDQLNTIASAYEPSFRLTATGRVPDAGYRAELAGASVAVQLRAVFNGEASAAVADCLSAGLPTVVPDAGWFAELPRDAVVHVSSDTSPERLADTIGALMADAGRRSALSSRAQEHATANSFQSVAERLATHLEESFRASSVGRRADALRGR